MCLLVVVIRAIMKLYDPIGRRSVRFHEYDHEEALISLDNPESRLERLPSRSAFWFGWFAFQPSTEVYQPKLSTP